MSEAQKIADTIDGFLADSYFTSKRAFAIELSPDDWRSIEQALRDVGGEAAPESFSLMAELKKKLPQGSPVAWRWRIESKDQLPWLYATEAPRNLDPRIGKWEIEPLYAAQDSSQYVPHESPDAARYRWLRDNANKGGFLDTQHPRVAIPATGGRGEGFRLAHPKGEEMDAAIDASRCISDASPSKEKP